MRICHGLFEQLCAQERDKNKHFFFFFTLGFPGAKDFDMPCECIKTGSDYVLSVYLKVIKTRRADACHLLYHIINIRHFRTWSSIH